MTTTTLWLTALLAICVKTSTKAEIEVGVGIGDITGPVTDVQFMGMAAPKQIGRGLHFRLFSRAFVARDTVTNKSIAFASLDNGMGTSFDHPQSLLPSLFFLSSVFMRY